MVLEWMEVFVSALITDCRRAGLQHFFIVDAYQKMDKNDKVCESCARAVAIDPDRDTAYRYWGNALMRENKLKEAKEKLIEGVIAAPYSRLPWQFLMNWAARNQIDLSHSQKRSRMRSR